mgnify:FL=1|tara:strand:+ start:2831 stop:3694 length:864 start_codon:yes stop_codon:yes gene_type:complete
MKICTTREEMLAQSAAWKNTSQSVCLVPTMGNLHDGHLSLLEVATAHSDKVITSIYVNPLQFAPSEDFDKYPRTQSADLDKLAATSLCDAVFMPETMYEDDHATKIFPGSLADGLEGVSRPHFFTGVATVVNQLFEQTDADKAVFGEKDFQQLRVIQQMVLDRHIQIEVIAAPTLREADGLAMSSRNGYLTTTQRAQAPALYQALQKAAESLYAGVEVAKILSTAQQDLVATGFDSVDYFILCATDTLAPLMKLKNKSNLAEGDTNGAVLLAAARIGDIRLIDNLRV